MSDLIDWAASCKYDPVKFVEEGFDWGEGDLAEYDGPDDWQKEFLADLGREVERAEREGGPVRFATASGHGIGKSALVSWVVLWYMSTRPDCLITVTANTERQLKNRTWREVAKWWKKCITRGWFRWERESFRSNDRPETWFAAAIPWSENNSEAFAGQHEKYTMVIMDEASGVANVIWEVVSGAMTTPGAIHLAFGNPTRPSGKFFDCFNKQGHRWKTRNIDARSAKMADKTYLQELVDDFGEESDYVRVRVMGQFPRQASAQLIPTDIVEDAQARRLPKEEYDHLPLLMGVDVARFGDDSTCFVWRRGPKVIDYEFHQSRDIIDISRIVAAHLEREPAMCFVDEIGYGAGVLDALKKYGFDPIGVSTQRKATNPRVYYNLRIELWDQMRKWLETADIPAEQRIKEQFTGPEYMFERATARMILERKEDMKKRGLESPDFADALALTFVIPGMSSPAQTDEDEFFAMLRGNRSPQDTGRDRHTGY